MSGQGKMLAGRVHRVKTGGTRVADHAVERFRERWPDGNHLSDTEVRRWIHDHVLAALRREDWVDVDSGGKYVPFSYMGEDGYAVVTTDGTIATLLFEEWCPTANRILASRAAG